MRGRLVRSRFDRILVAYYKMFDHNLQQVEQNMFSFGSDNTIPGPSTLQSTESIETQYAAHSLTHTLHVMDPSGAPVILHYDGKTSTTHKPAYLFREPVLFPDASR